MLKFKTIHLVKKIFWNKVIVNIIWTSRQLTSPDVDDATDLPLIFTLEEDDPNILTLPNFIEDA